MYNNINDPQAFTHARALQLEGFKLVGCCDQNPLVAKEFAQKWSIPIYDCTVENLLKKVRHIELVSVCVPTEMQCVVIADLVKAKTKIGVVILEKPVSKDASKIRFITSSLKKMGIHAIVNYFRSFDPFYVALEEWMMVRKNKMISVNARYYGTMEDNGCHWLERCISMFGNFVSSSNVRTLPIQSSNLFEIEFQESMVLFEQVNKRCSYSPMILEIQLEDELLRVIDSEERVEYFIAKNDQKFIGYKNLVQQKLPFKVSAPTHLSFQMTFKKAKEVIRGDYNDWSQLYRAEEIARILEKI